MVIRDACPSCKSPRYTKMVHYDGVWLYYRFHLSYRDVQELLFERGIDVSPLSVRKAER
jgi:putative transposase